MDKEINKAVIPAAGTGDRLAPLTDYLPKGMLPLGKKPVLHHIVDELREASVDEIAIVARSNHTAIFTYFRDVEGVELIIDDSQAGPGGALLEAQSFVGDEDFITIFADAPVRGKARGQYLYELARIKHVKDADAVLAAYEVPRNEADRRGIISFKGTERLMDGVTRIDEIKEKPSPEELKSRIWATACRYVLDDSIFTALENIEPDGDGELQLTDAIQYLIEEGGNVLGYPLKTALKRYDTGTFEGYFEAFHDFTEETELE